MKFTVSFDCDNEAFEDLEAEIARILRYVATRADHHSTLSGVCLDVNGNKVGRFGLEDGREGMWDEKGAV